MNHSECPQLRTLCFISLWLPKKAYWRLVICVLICTHHLFPPFTKEPEVFASYTASHSSSCNHIWFRTRRPVTKWIPVVLKVVPHCMFKGWNVLPAKQKYSMFLCFLYVLVRNGMRWKFWRPCWHVQNLWKCLISTLVHAQPSQSCPVCHLETFKVGINETWLLAWTPSPLSSCCLSFWTLILCLALERQKPGRCLVAWVFKVKIEVRSNETNNKLGTY